MNGTEDPDCYYFETKESLSSALRMPTILGIMMIDPEALQAAHLLVEQYGRGALPRAADMVDVLASKGDASGHRWWRQVMVEISAILQREHPRKPFADGETAKENDCNTAGGDIASPAQASR
jgi:hypothetical protein